MPLNPVSQLDFEAEYGRKYRSTIPHSVPGHATLLEIAAAAIGDTAPAARRILVVGPGPGDELPQLLDASPEAGFVVVEPSAQMLRTCIETVRGHGGFERCQWVPKTLEEAVRLGLLQRDFDGVICHNVLHLMAADQQDLMIERLVEQSLPGGVLLISSYSEAAEPWVCETIFSIASRIYPPGSELPGSNSALSGPVCTLVDHQAEPLLIVRAMTPGEASVAVNFLSCFFEAS